MLINGRLFCYFDSEEVPKDLLNDLNKDVSPDQVWDTVSVTHRWYNCYGNDRLYVPVFIIFKVNMQSSTNSNLANIQWIYLFLQNLRKKLRLRRK